MLNAVVHSIKPTMVGLGMPPFKLFGFFLVFGLFAMSAPQLLIRIVTVKNSNQARIAVWWAGFFNIIIITSFAVIGVGCRVLFPNLAAWDLASPQIASALLPPIIGGAAPFGSPGGHDVHHRLAFAHGRLGGGP